MILHSVSTTKNTHNLNKQTIKMKLILASLIASAAAFAPSQVAKSSTALNAFDSFPTTTAAAKGTATTIAATIHHYCR